MGAWFEAIKAKRRLLQGVLLSLMRPGAVPGIGRDADAVWMPMRLGRTTVHLEVRGPSDARHAFVNLHENENTSVRAATALLSEREDGDGRLIVLRGQGRRNIVFWIGARPHLFDPNRIFSDQGIEDTLRFHGAYSQPAQAALVGLRAAILGQLHTPRTTLIVALHNNGIGHYTIDSHLPGGAEAADAEAVQVDALADPGDFFLVNQRSAYDALCGSGFGVVLQRDDATDDGSMSRHFRGARPLYVNVEARHGHLREQGRMLEALLERAPRITVD